MFDTYQGLMSGAEVWDEDEACEECEEDTTYFYSDKQKEVEDDENEFATNMSLHGNPFGPVPALVEESQSEGEDDEILWGSDEEDKDEVEEDHCEEPIWEPLAESQDFLNFSIFLL